MACNIRLLFFLDIHAMECVFIFEHVGLGVRNPFLLATYYQLTRHISTRPGMAHITNATTRIGGNREQRL